MTKLRIVIFLLTLVIVGTAGTILALYAKGFRLNQNKLVDGGLMVVNSDPTGAQIYVDGELKAATNTNLSLSPHEYNVEIKKAGYSTWTKKIRVEREIVTQIDAALFPLASSLSPLTINGALNPKISPSYSKIAYAVPLTKDNPTTAGLWIAETVDLPLGFSRPATRITDGDLKDFDWQWSPDGVNILLSNKTGAFILRADTFTAQANLVNIKPTLVKTQTEWNTVEQKRVQSLLSRVDDRIAQIITNNTKNIVFSPDETKILYQGTKDATLPSEVVKQLPGSSTQTESRNIKKDLFYVYDIKEDRNFEITETDGVIYWYPNSKNLLLPKKDKVQICDYDNTNRQTIYAGSYIPMSAFPSLSLARIFILTNLGAKDVVSNLYTLNLK